MPAPDFESKTVLELRKIAKENGVKLSAGISKAGIIERLQAALAEEEPAAPAARLIPAASVEESASVPPAAGIPARPAAAVQTAAERPAAAPSSPDAAQPQFRAAWHNPAPRFGTKPAYQAPERAPRPAYNRPPAPANDVPRTTTTRPTGFTPRFGPAPQEQRIEQPLRQEEERAFRPAAPAAPYAPERRSYPEAPRPAYERPAYDERPQRPAYEAPAPGYDSSFSRPQRPAYAAPRREQPYYAAPEAPAPNPAVSEMLAAGECLDGEGTLELHPEGYGFLRSKNYLSSSRDIYVSIAQVRRFGLRTGDYIVGKTRPQRDGDKYTAMLYINEINGLSPEQQFSRPCFEDLTPIYPTRRINLEAADQPTNDMRIIDLIAPLGFGQRALLLCPPDTGKTELLRDFANVICANHPEATVMVMLLDENPEDVTLFRDQVNCTVLASTFDQPPENHLRLTDMVQSRAERLVEQGKDVILIVDSLTRLAKVCTTAAIQQGRTTPGMVNPTSLFRAKKLFGAARCMKEGGSLTIIAAMNVETGSKVDDSITEEFKGAANMELMLDASVARAGIHPAINLPMSGTKRAEALLDRAQLEGLQLIRSIMASTRSSAAIPQLQSMMDVAATNDELLKKIKDWAQIMSKGQ